jgi:CheY-like chemotaxis protein
VVITPLQRDAMLPVERPSSRNVLLVGDPGSAQGVLRTVLTRLDYAVTPVPTGTEALAAILRNRFAVALVALRLPDMPGLALIRRLAAHAPGGIKLPTLVFGDASGRAGLAREIREAGVDGFFETPIPFTKLVAAIRELTQSQRRMPAAEDSLAVPVELDRLNSFTDGDPALQQELCDLYLASADLYLARMATALHEQRDWSAPAHGLTGSSGNFGAHVVARLAADAEREVPTGETLNALIDSVAQVRRFIERGIPAGPPDRAAGPYVGTPQQCGADRKRSRDRS